MIRRTVLLLLLAAPVGAATPVSPRVVEYTIDVSSPGPERPVRTRDHFASVIGHTVTMRTEPELEGRHRFHGKVLAAGDDAVTIAGTQSDSEPLDIPYDAIVRANLIDEGLTT